MTDMYEICTNALHCSGQLEVGESLGTQPIELQEVSFQPACNVINRPLEDDRSRTLGLVQLEGPSDTPTDASCIIKCGAHFVFHISHRHAFAHKHTTMN